MGTLPFISYGLDIEIDTGAGVVDPDLAPIRAIALSAVGFDEVHRGDERQMLVDLEARLRSLAPGVIATWNGSVFDLPYLARRAARHDVRLGLVLVEDPAATLGRRPLPGHAGAHRARWGEHRHLDTFRIYGDTAPASPWTALLGRARRRGVIADSGDLLNEALHANAPSDARLARVLAARRAAAALRAIDHLEPAELGEAPAAPPRRRLDAALEVRPAVAGL